MIHVIRSDICILKWRVERLLSLRSVKTFHRRQNWCGRRGGFGKQVSSRNYLQVIGTTTGCTSPSIYLFTDSQRYFFNCGENTIRLFCELNKSFDATKIFLTRLSWTESLAGLPLAFRYLNRAGKLDQHVFGPKEATNLIKSTSIFSRVLHNLNRDVSLRFTGYSVECSPPYADDNVTIKPIVLDGRKGKISSLATDLSVCYLCEFSDLPGNLLRDRVKEYGLSAHCCNSLLAGKVVTTADGMQIFPNDVVTPSTPGQKFMIVDCPSFKLRDLLVSNVDVIPQEKPLTLVVHITPQEIIESKPYKSWMSKLGDSTEHIFLNKTVPLAKSPFQKGAELLSRLHAVSPSNFPDMSCSDTREEVCNLPTSSVHGENLLTYNFRPLRREGLCRNSIPGKCDFDQVKKQADKQMATFKSHATNCQGTGEDYSSMSDPWVTFLGTGSSTPSVFRSNSAILLQISTDKAMMLDCGEGAYTQLQRMYGDKTDDVLRSLSCVFVSHKHADHHIGLVRLLLEHQHLSSGHQAEPLCIVGPKRLQDWLMECSRIERNLHFRFVTFTELKESGPEQHIGDVLSQLDLTKFHVVPVVHCADSHGLVLEHSSGWKLVYSGDCRPSETLVQAGKDATLLIHEATFLDHGKKDSIEMQHSTLTEAVDVSSRMRAKFTILTHLSLNRAQYHPQRIASLRLPPGVSTAFDFMTVRLRDLPSLHKIRPAICHVMREQFIHTSKTRQVRRTGSDLREIRTERNSI